MSVVVRNVENSQQTSRLLFVGFLGGGALKGKKGCRQIGSAPFGSLCCLRGNLFPEYLKGKEGVKQKCNKSAQPLKIFLCLLFYVLHCAAYRGGTTSHSCVFVVVYYIFLFLLSWNQVMQMHEWAGLAALKQEGLCACHSALLQFDAALHML